MVWWNHLKIVTIAIQVFFVLLQLDVWEWLSHSPWLCLETPTPRNWCIRICWEIAKYNVSCGFYLVPQLGRLANRTLTSDNNYNHNNKGHFESLSQEEGTEQRQQAAECFDCLSFRWIWTGVRSWSRQHVCYQQQQISAPGGTRLCQVWSSVHWLVYSKLPGHQWIGGYRSNGVLHTSLYLLHTWSRRTSVEVKSRNSSGRLRNRSWVYQCHGDVQQDQGTS